VILNNNKTNKKNHHLSPIIMTYQSADLIDGNNKGVTFTSKHTWDQRAYIVYSFILIDEILYRLRSAFILK
jgi:hypothetical protein